MIFSSEHITVLFIMILYGFLSGGSAIILKIGIFKAGGIKINNFVHDIIPAAWQLITTPIWLIGGIIAVTGFILYTVALNIYDVSVIKPLVNTNLLFTFILAYLVFKEKLNAIEWFGVGILILGIISIAFSPEIKSTNLMNIPLLIAILPITIVMIILMVLVMFVFKKGQSELVFPIFAGTFYGLGTIFTKSLLISLNKINNHDLVIITILLFSIFMLLLTYFFAIVNQMLAFEKGRLSVVSPITNSLSVVVSFIGAFFIFFEDIIVQVEGKIIFQSFLKIIGLVCILAALIILRREIIIIPEKTIQKT